jgi:hypothetical protein
MWERYAAGIDREHWRRIHDEMNDPGVVRPVLIFVVDPELERIRACPHHHPACCNSPAPFCDLYMINPTREQCLACLEEGRAR